MLVSDSPYEMHVELSALKHLGIGLYSNVPAVLAEAVANAWDADATRVSIRTGLGDSDIRISDDGHGMSVKDVNEKYLRVGYERRKTGAKTPRFKRDVMGRKGIGKLSLFSIADTVTVHTVKDGQSHAFEMNVEDMKNAFNAETPTYRPRPVSPDPGLKKGTLIVLPESSTSSTPKRRGKSWPAGSLSARTRRLRSSSTASPSQPRTGTTRRSSTCGCWGSVERRPPRNRRPNRSQSCPPKSLSGTARSASTAG